MSAGPSRCGAGRRPEDIRCRGRLWRCNLKEIVKATKQPDLRICPNCGARNKAKWEYCVSCSEPLAGVPTGDEVAASVIPPTSTPDEGETALPWKSLLAFVAAVGVGVWIYQAAR